MKFKNKILASVLAVVLAFGILGLPVFGLAEVFAQSAVVATKTLEVKKVDKSYDVETNNYLTFADYCTTSGAEAIFRAPDGTLSTGDSQGASLRTPGLYALQFKLEESDNFFIYSDVIYIPVSNGSGDASKITLDGKMNAVVKPGTIVTVPMPIKSDGTEDKSVNIKVYNAYGKEVVATKNSVTQKWAFTNDANVLGTYYVEYSKVVPCGKFNDTKYKYETISFDANSTNTVASVSNQSASSSSSETAGLVVSNTGIAQEKDFIYLFKNYTINNAIFKNADGTTNADADIFLTIRDVNTEKFYNFNNGKFELLSSDQTGAKINIENILDSFSLKNIQNVNKDTYEGHTYDFSYTTTVAAKDYEQKITKKEKFNVESVVMSTTSLVKGEITNMVKVDKIETYDISQIVFPSLKLTGANGYDIDAIKALINEVELQITPSGGSKIYSKPVADANALNDKGVGITESEALNILDTEFTYHYNKNMTKDRLSLAVKYVITLSADEFDLDLSSDYTVFARTESEDHEAPSSITIVGNITTSTNGEIVVPYATASDVDDLNSKTSGAIVTAEILGGAFASYTSVEMGSTVKGLTDGLYTIRYTAKDGAEVANTRVQYLKFKVERNSATSVEAPFVSVTQFNEDENKASFVVDTNADYVLVFNGENGAYSPSKITYEAGEVKAFEFEYDKEFNCVVVFANTNSYGTSYTAVKINDGKVGNSIAQFGYGNWNQTVVKLTPNVSTEVKVGDKVYWFGNENFDIETPEGSKFVVTDSNMFTFFTAGVYTINSTERIEVNGGESVYKAVTKITVKNEQSTLSIVEPIGNKIVAKLGEKFNLSFPVATNYYGYEVSVVVKDSAGNVIENAIGNNGINKTFEIKEEDVYTFEYSFKSDLGKSTYKVTVIAGNIASPSITIPEKNQNMIWEGKTIKYFLQNGSAIDKNGNAVAVTLSCYDQYGNKLEIKTEDNKQYVELKGAGFYKVYYTAVDSDNLMSVVESSFAVEFPEEEEAGMSAWAIIGIIFGSLVVACGIALCVIFIIKNSQKKQRFINKAKAQKKQEKKEVIENTKLYTIAESKDEKHWLVKIGNKTIAKVNTKADAINKIEEVHKKGEKTIKVYNKNGRLIDSI